MKLLFRDETGYSLVQQEMVFFFCRIQGHAALLCQLIHLQRRHDDTDVVKQCGCFYFHRIQMVQIRKPQGCLRHLLRMLQGFGLAMSQVGVSDGSCDISGVHTTSFM